MTEIPAFTNVPFPDRLLASRSPGHTSPFLTVAIPQYKQRAYLEIVLASLFEQQYEDFEIVVSDDCSPDDSNAVLPAILEASGRPFRYYAQPTNLGYDGNVRFLLAVTRGQYVFLLGNDDALAGPAVLDEVAGLLKALAFPQVAFTNVKDWQGVAAPMRRADRTAVLGSGPDCAVKHFRTFSFVGGLIYDAGWARRFETDRWDKSVYYQIYIATRIIAAGGIVASLDCAAVAKDVRIGGHSCPNAETGLAKEPWSIAPRHSGLDNVIRVTVDAIVPEVAPSQRSKYIRGVVTQIYTRTYPYWLLMNRRHGNWGLALGLARGMWPSLYLRDLTHPLGPGTSFTLWVLYIVYTLAGLTLPAHWLISPRT